MSSHSRERRREVRKLHVDLKLRRRRCTIAARMKVKCSTNSINSSSFSSSQWSSCQASWQQNGQQQSRSQFGTTNSSHSHHSNSSSNSQQTHKKSTVGSQSSEMRPKMMILQTRGQNLPATVPSYYKKKVPSACRLLPSTITKRMRAPEKHNRTSYRRRSSAENDDNDGQPEWYNDKDFPQAVVRPK